MIKFTNKEKTVFAKTFRQTLYFILTFSFIFIIHAIADKYKSKTFDEHSIVENIQLTFLVLSGWIFVINGIFHKKFRPVLFLLASLSFLASCRELDMFFDKQVPIISWEVGFLFPICAMIYAYKNKRTVRNTLIEFYSSPSF